ncbi:MAG: DUF424 family protein [Fervidicoccaceae archaeon]
MEEIFSLKVIKTEEMKTVLVCDAELLGKKFIDGKKILDINEEYYGGEMVDEEEAMRSILDADYISLIGEKSVKLGIKMGLVHPEAVLKVSGVPYAIYINTLI